MDKILNSKKKNKLLTSKRGQVSIFIFVGILIISAILIFFLWGGPTFISKGTGLKGFEGCVKDATTSGIMRLEGNAGLINPGFSYKYQGDNITYLCYTSDYYKTCTVQIPFLKNTFRENLEKLIRNKVNSCYDASLDSLKNQGYAVASGKVDYTIEIKPGVVQLNINAPTSVGNQKFTKFEVKINKPIYKMTMIATSILQSETKYGDSDVSSMMAYYPDYYIDKIKRGDGTTIYILENKALKDKFKFASRSLVFPAGYIFGGEK